MSQVTVNLPDLLRERLEVQAREDGISINDYIVGALARSLTDGYHVQVVPPEQIAQQRADFAALRKRLKKMSTNIDIDQVLAAREVVDPEPDLSPEVIQKVQAMIAEKKVARKVPS